jgi:hypothetical protein
LIIGNEKWKGWRNKLGRREPYTEIGILRVPCARCSEPSTQQWQICSLENLFYGLCTSCDVELNRLVLEFFSVDRIEVVMNRYKASLGVTDS